MRVLFADRSFERLLDVLCPIFQGHDVRAANVKEDDDALSWAEVLVVGPPIPVDDSILDRAPGLKLVHQWGVGTEAIDVEACTRRALPVCNVPSRGTGNAEGVAEIALLHMLLLAKRYYRCCENIKKRRAFAPRGMTLWGKKACVIGLGGVGLAVAERLSGLGMSVVGVNRTLRPELEGFGFESLHHLAQLRDAVKGCHFVIIALTLTPETEGIIDEDVLSSMERYSFLINVARAGLVRRSALEKALDEGWIAGAGLDVFWDEPVSPDDPFLNRQNVTITPHVGGTNDAAQEKIPAFIAENVNRLERGEPLKSCLNCGKLVQGGDQEHSSAETG